MRYFYTCVNEDGDVYYEGTDKFRAFENLDEFPNDTIVVSYRKVER